MGRPRYWTERQITYLSGPYAGCELHWVDREAYESRGGSHAGRGPKGYRYTDARIYEEV
jgi:hypothetical protein